MPKRTSSIKKAKRDFSQVAFDMVQRLTGEKPKPDEKKEAMSTALDDAELRKQVMREMGRRGGVRGGKARAEKLSAAERIEFARLAATARWKKSDD